MNDCPFCNVKDSEIILESKNSFALYDKFPVNNGHLLIVPKCHISNYFDLKKEEKNDLWELVDKASDLLTIKYSPSGFNIGIPTTNWFFGFLNVKTVGI